MAALAEAVNMLNTAHWLPPLFSSNSYISSLYSQYVHNMYVQLIVPSKTNVCIYIKQLLENIMLPHADDDYEKTCTCITFVHMWQVRLGAARLE